MSQSKDEEETAEIVRRLKSLVKIVVDDLQSEIKTSKSLAGNLKDINKDVETLYDRYGKVKTQIETIEDEFKVKYDENKMRHSGFEKQLSSLEKYLKKIEYRPLTNLYTKTKRIAELRDYDIDVIENFKSTHKEDAFVWETIGHIYWMVKKPAPAIYEAFNQAVTLSDGSPSSCMVCGMAIFTEGEKESIITNLTRAESFKENCECPTFLINAALIYSEIKDREKAFEKLKAFKKISSDTIKFHLVEGLIHGSLLEHTEALRAFENGLTLDENNIELLTNKGISLNYLKNEDAETTLLKAHEINPDFHYTNMSLARYYNEKNDEKTALTYLENALRSDEAEICDLCFKGRLLYKLNKVRDSQELYESIFDEIKHKECVPFYRNYSETILYQKSEEEIKTFLDTNLETIKKTPEWIISLVSLIKDRQHDELADELFIEVNPVGITNIGLLNSYSWNAYNLGKSKIALPYIEKVIKANPDDAHYLDTYACILYDLGDEKGAIKTFKAAVENAEKRSQITLDVMKELYEAVGLNERFKELIKKFD